MHVTFTDLVENDDYGYEIKEPTEEPIEKIGNSFVFSHLIFYVFKTRNKMTHGSIYTDNKDNL